MLQVDDELGGNPVTCPECGAIIWMFAFVMSLAL